MNKRKEAERDVLNLRIFLVSRFVEAMAFIYICEQIIRSIYRSLFLPLMTDVLQVGSISFSNGATKSMLQMFLQAIWNMISSRFPAFLQAPISDNLSSMLQTQVQAPEFIAQYGTGMVNAYYTSIIIIIILQVLLQLAPYIIATWWYSTNVKKKMDELREIDMYYIKQEEKQRNLLFSDITHDIKTPITTIVGYSRALNDGVIKDESKKKDYLNAIYAKSLRISELITMLFEFVKLDSTGFELHMESCDLAELLRENIISVFTDFEDKGIYMDFDIIEEECPCVVDRVQMSRVIMNLLTNAIRYSNSGDNAFISMEIVDGDKPHYLISVADTGLPISEEFAKVIFNPFSRSDEARQTTSGGSGLGLSIAHKVAEMHGGELLLNLDYGNGFSKAFQIIVPIP